MNRPYRLRLQPLLIALIALPVALLASCTRAPSQEDTSVAAGNAQTPASETPAEVIGSDAAPGPAGPVTVEPPRPQVMEGVPTKIKMPPPTTHTPPVALGAAIDYGCESGSTLRVRYGNGVAEIAWTGGDHLRLTAQAADAGGGELYAGDGYQLRRLGSAVQLQPSGGGSEWRCVEANASA